MPKISKKADILPTNDSAHKPERVDARVLRSKEAVIKATHQLLTGLGFSGVSVDEVSKLSGVAKTTIYRHWPTRTALLLDACRQLGTKPPMPDTGSLERDLIEIATFAAGQLNRAKWPLVLPSIIDAAERDSSIAKVHSAMHAGMTAPIREIIERAKQRGELAADTPTTQVVAALLGPLFYRRWFSREPIDSEFVEGVVKRAVDGFASY